MRAINSLSFILVKSAADKLVLFPPFWMHPHRAVTVEQGVKHVATSWFCFA